MFADYRVPQALAGLGVLVYSDALMGALQRKEVILPGDERECEIRGCSIHAVELLRDALLQRAGPSGTRYPICAVSIDFMLWDYAQERREALARFPIHRVRSIFY